MGADRNLPIGENVQKYVGEKLEMIDITPAIKYAQIIHLLSQ
jgi:hypothetical protein